MKTSCSQIDYDVFFFPIRSSEFTKLLNFESSVNSLVKFSVIIYARVDDNSFPEASRRQRRHPGDTAVTQGAMTGGGFSELYEVSKL